MWGHPASCGAVGLCEGWGEPLGPQEGGEDFWDTCVGPSASRENLSFAIFISLAQHLCAASPDLLFWLSLG